MPGNEVMGKMFAKADQPHLALVRLDNNFHASELGHVKGLIWDCVAILSSFCLIGSCLSVSTISLEPLEIYNFTIWDSMLGYARKLLRSFTRVVI